MSRVPVPRGLDENIANALREITQRIEKIQNVTDKFSIESDDRGRPRLYVKTPDGKASIGASVEDKGGVDELGRHLDGKKKDIINIRKIKCDELEVSNDSIHIGNAVIHHDKDGLYMTNVNGNRAFSFGTAGGAVGGVTEIDFGGTVTVEVGDASVSVSDADVTATSVISATMSYSATADHSADEALISNVILCVETASAGSGFRIKAFCPDKTWGKYNINWVRS